MASFDPRREGGRGARRGRRGTRRAPRASATATRGVRKPPRPSPWDLRRRPRAADPTRAAPWRPPWWSTCASRRGAWRRGTRRPRRTRGRRGTSPGRRRPSRAPRRWRRPTPGTRRARPPRRPETSPGTRLGTMDRRRREVRLETPAAAVWASVPESPPRAPRRTPTRMGFGAASAGAATARARDASPNPRDSRRLGGSPRTEAHPSRRPSPRACRPPSPRTRTSPPRPPRPRARHGGLCPEPRDDRAAVPPGQRCRLARVEADYKWRPRASRRARVLCASLRVFEEAPHADVRGPRLVRGRAHRRRRWCRRETPPAQTPRTLRGCARGPTPASGRWGGSRRARGRARRDPSRPHRLRRQTSAAPHAPVAVSGAAPATNFARRALLTSGIRPPTWSGVFRARCRRRAGPHRWRARVWHRAARPRELASRALSNPSLRDLTASPTRGPEAPDPPPPRSRSHARRRHAR